MRSLAWTLVLVVSIPGLAHAQPTGEAEKLRKQAAALVAEGDHDGAADKLREALVHSNHAQIYFDLCLVLEAADKLNQARSACRAVRHGDDADEALLANARKALDRVNRKLSGEAPPPDPDPPVEPDPPPPDPDPPVDPAPPPDPDPDPPPPTNGSGFTNGQTGNGGTVTQPPVPIQPEPEKPLSFGVKLGLNVASVSADDDSTSEFVESKSDLAIGGIGVYRLTPLVSLGIEGMLMGKGTAFSDFTDGTIDLLYLEVPVTARFNLVLNDQITVLGFGGLAPAILLSASDVDGEDIYDDTTPVDVGFVIGGGVEVAMGSGAITGDIRATVGLVNVDATDEGFVDLLNRTFSFLAGYQF